MRAAVVVEHGDTSKISYYEDYRKPTVGDDQVLVRVHATAVNYHDIFTRRGMPGIKVPMPVITGSDIAGEVMEVGADVSGWRPGDRVLIDPMMNDGKRSGIIGEIADGGKAEYVAAFEYQLIPLDAHVSFEHAAALPIAYGTAHRMLLSAGRLSMGETVLILGASGGVGVACVQLALLAGARVLACTSSPEKTARLYGLGADHCVNYAQQDLCDAVHAIAGKPRISGGGGVDVVVNFTGGDTWMPSIKCVRKGGRILTCGATAGYDVGTDLRYVWSFEHQILGSNGWQRSDLTALLGLVARGRLIPVIDAVVPIDGVAEAEQMMEDRKVFGKILVRP